MKYHHIERLRVRLDIVSPVHIGSSSQERLSKKECIIDNNKGRVYVPDVPRLLQVFENRGCLPQYEEFLMEPSLPGNKSRSLEQFMRSMNIPVTGKEDWIQYSLVVSTRDIGAVNVLNRCVKNSQGNPYIPGSSIKGALRTALLAARMSEQAVRALVDSAKFDPKNRRPGNEENALRVLGFPGNKPADAVNDLLRSLQVSDSAPFDGLSMTVCKKLELTQKGKINGMVQGFSGGKSAPPLYRECIMPGRSTRFYMTLDKTLSGSRLTFQNIEDALKEWNRIQREYMDQFDLSQICHDENTNGGIPLTLGGGVGFQSKSLIYRAKDPELVRKTVHAVLKKQFERTYLPYEDEAAPYRMKIAVNAGKYYPMGQCRLTVEE